ncbi:MAG: PorT family protein [Bacteroidales bacterium]|nr:PorT family protein [Bacteroidales bacterium]
MQDNGKELDRIVRSIMLDAEEQVSPGVWDAVSGRLVRHRRLVWVRRAGLAVSAAAAAVALFLLLNPFSDENTNQPILNKHNQIAEIAISEPVVVPAPAEDVRIAQAQPVQRASADSENVYVPAEVSGPAVAPVVIEEMDGVGTGDDAKCPVENDDKSIKDDRDVFEELVAKEEVVKSGKSRRISITASGNLLTNDDPSASFKRVNRAPSLAAREPGIEELGSNTFGVPVSAGIGLRYDINRRWAVGTGVSYSLLSRSFKGNFTFPSNGTVSTASGEIENRQHFLGVPVNVYYNVLDSRAIRFYASAGATFERCLSDRYSMNKVTITENVRGIQVSAAAGLGVEFRITPFLGMYIDPSLRYYFDCGQPVSIRTQQPLLVSLELGFRFGL